MTDNCIERLRQFPHLEHLTLHANISFDGLMKLGQLRCREVIVWTPSIDEGNVESLLNNYSGLPKLEVQSPWISYDLELALKSKFQNSAKSKKIEVTTGLYETVRDSFWPEYPDTIQDWSVLTRWLPKTMFVHLVFVRTVPVSELEQLTNLHSLEIRCSDPIPYATLERLYQMPVRFSVETPWSEELLNHLTEIRQKYDLICKGSDPWLFRYFETNRDEIWDWPTTVEIYADDTVLLEHCVRNEPQVTALSLSTPGPDLDLSALASASHITSIRIGAAHFGREQWNQVWNAQHTTRLMIDGGWLKDEDLEGIDRLRNLEVLQLVDVPITDRGLAQIAKLKTLRKLQLMAADLGSGPYLTDQGGMLIGQLPRLEQLVLRDQLVEGRCFSHWQNLQQLKSLDLRNCDIRDDSLHSLAALRNLETLILADTPITDASRPALQKFPPGVYIDTSRTRLTKNGRR